MGSKQSASAAFYCALAGIVMAYGWGYRGIVGHEGGAMIPGAMLGMALCLGSGRPDWFRRAAVAGLFGAVGWAWGGSMSYMEHTFYTVSKSFPDVYYGYTILFFMGGLWAGIGGAVLGLAFTQPRSQLERFTGPFVAMSASFLLVYLYLFFDYSSRDALSRFTAEHFHDGDWLPASITLAVCGLYALLRPRERSEALLFCGCAAAWWVGYLAFTKLGGIRLAPPYRSESWGGVVGILAALVVYLVRTRNRAALMMCLYGILGGGLAFSLAVFVRHPVRVEWGPFASWGGMMQWKIAEESFGLFMGIAIALAAMRFARGGLAPAPEDVEPKRLDVFAVFVVLVGLMWVNLRRVPMAWIHRYELLTSEPAGGLAPWMWYALGGVLISALVWYTLYLHYRGELVIAPAGAYAKGAWVLIFLLWAPAIGSFIQHLPTAQQRGYPLVDVTFMAMVLAATAMLLAHGRNAHLVPAPVLAQTPPSDRKWLVGGGYYALCALTPLVLLGITMGSMAMQEEPAPGYRLRFGPDAYWREAMLVMGQWDTAGIADRPGAPYETSEDIPFTAVHFKRDRSAVVTMPDGAEITDAHRWHHADSRVWFGWHGRNPEHPEHRTLMLSLESGRVYVPWPPTPNGPSHYIVLERRADE